MPPCSRSGLVITTDRASGLANPGGKPWSGGTGPAGGAGGEGGDGTASSGVKRDGKGEGGTLLGQQLTEFVLTNPVVGPAVAELLTNAMVWPDSSGATRAATALQRMVPKIKHLPQYHHVVGAMLRVVLWGLGRLAAHLPVMLSWIVFDHLVQGFLICSVDNWRARFSSAPLACLCAAGEPATSFRASLLLMPDA